MLTITKRDVTNDKGKVTGREYLVNDKVFTSADDAYDYITAENEKAVAAEAARIAEKEKPIRVKVNDKGQLDVTFTGADAEVGHFPAFKFYGKQLAIVLAHMPEIVAFAEANKQHIAPTWASKGKSARA